MSADRATAAFCLATALALLWLVWSWEPPQRPGPPYWTPVVVTATSLPATVPATPTRAPLVWQTPLIREPILSTPLPTATETPAPTMTATPEPTSTRVPQTPVQKGMTDAIREF